MGKLFIIGNGFDLSHKMLTEYKDFRTYVMKEYGLPEPQEEVPDIPDSFLLPDGGEGVDTQDAMHLALWLLTWCNGKKDCKWKKFESNLAKLDYAIVMNDNTIFCGDKDNPFREAANYEMFANDLKVAMQKLPEIFARWVKNIQISKDQKRDVVDLFDGSSMFLNFNYTETLETLYGISDEKVCHIHGKRGGNEPLIVGHRKKKQREFHVHYAADSILQGIDQDLKKDTKSAWKRHREFFEQLKDSDITEIYSYGFSFSRVDMSYIRKICSDIDTQKIIWYQNDFKLTDKKKHKNEQKIRSAGFRGEFGTPFHITN